ncbi:T9SS type A sorting domain-containing protein [Flavobacterium cellulosilyticum]|uniref:T9SS type A sorting domain-containing protein n=1 Tax=Flavobacterium cellulosilyticum TaxID=2541731 RepID=A0A4R5C7J0_9FLAO|nr:T9SS type A sorting domain-containing protein [Flavobacterium cellulosilyticum]TDD94093.1 T9SS type A sorting domain-containing protein [Flavobacterium cellulosilyticum]
MKKKLLLLILPILFIGLTVNAQTKTWDFGNNGGGYWPITASGVGTIGAGTEAVIDKLGLFSNDPANTGIVNFGAVNASGASFDDLYVGVNRFQLNGGGGGTAGNVLPTQRYVYFTVSGACTVKVWFKTGSNGAVRSVLCTDGSAILGSGTSNSGGNLDLVIFTVNISAAQALGKKIYIYGDTTSSNLYKIEVTGATVTTPSLATTSFKKQSDVMVYAKNNRIFLSNIKSSTQVKVYNVLGAVVKSTKTDSDTNLDINKGGVYIVNVKSVDGEKSVKVIVQ